jgi:hypothetical protein
MMQAVTAVALTGADQQVTQTPTLYAGFTLRETAGATAVVRIYDNASGASTGTVLDEIALAANESAREYYIGGIRADKGVYVDVVSGAVAGSIRIR